VTLEPRPLPLVDVSLRDLADRHDLEIVGSDESVSFLGLLRSSRGITQVLTYVTSEAYFADFLASDISFAVVERRFARPSDKSLLVCPDYLGEETFFRIHRDLATTGQVTRLGAHREPSASVHQTAVVMDNVRLGEDCVIEPGAVIYPNTVIGARTVIKANSTIGGEGFEVKYIGGRRTRIPHTGGVFVDDDASVGSATAVDRGLFGTFTRIGRGTNIDNLVHVAHNVSIGEDCAVVACAEISGSAVLGRGVWYGPSAACNHEIQFGDYSFVGTGSVVTRDVPAFTLVAGSPAKQLGHVCRCRTRVDLSAGETGCPTCGTRLATDAAGVVHMLEGGPATAT
jgi:UDP-3-O-[3-hydroxymyristoyl] glucosamine N-acyltransferase